jgi:hypothetical protein
MVGVAKNRSRYDLVVYLLILSLGALQFAFARRAADYLNDSNYYELTKSVLNHAPYGYNGRPMTQLPPGLPYLMALLSLVIGPGYTAMLRVMAVFTTLALIASYELVRTLQSRPVAAMACLLLGSAPRLFAFSTSLVFADIPYFFFSMALLYGAIGLDTAKGGRLRWMAAILWSLLLAVTVLLKSVAISLLAALCCWFVVSALKDRPAARRRLLLFLPALAIGIGLEAGWMRWAAHHQVSDWSIPGYQEHYVAQLRLKDANDPEMGLAAWSDVIVRPIKNADDMASVMLGLFTHKEMAAAWYSPGTLIPLTLILLGLWRSFRKRGGGLVEWYFVCYLMMFLFWPWEFEIRFFYPIAPLAFLYALRGGCLVWQAARDRARIVGAAGLAFSITGGAGSVFWGRSVLHPGMEGCVAIWALLAALSFGLLWSGPNRIQRLDLLLRRPIVGWRPPLTISQGVVAVVVALVCIIGVVLQLQIGRENLKSDLSTDEFNYPEIEAAEWIKEHSAPGSVVMARKDDIVYHYSQRRVIWFPPTRDATLLMEGIHRHHIQFVVVHYGRDSYWRPPAADCFGALVHAYPGAFQLVHAGPHNGVFEVVQEGPASVSCVRPDGDGRSR